MPEPATQLTAADLAGFLHAVFEASDHLQPLDDPGDHHPAFQFEPAHYQPLGLARSVSIPLILRPPGGMIPLQSECTLLIAAVREALRKRKINAGDCKAFVPPEPQAEDEARVYFRLGAFTFLATAIPDPDRFDHWRVTIAINVDPDSVEDDD